MSEPWRWTLPGAIPEAIPATVIAAVYAIAAYFAPDAGFNAGSRGPGIAYAVTALVIFLGTPGTILRMEKKPY